MDDEAFTRKDILKIMAAVLVALNTVFSLLPTRSPSARCYSPDAPDEIRLYFAAVADIHTDALFFRDRTNILRKAFAGISKSTKKLDAVALAGDNTNCGDEKEYRLLKRLGFWLRTDAVVPCIGNHDSWHHSDDPDWETAKSLYLDYCAHCGVKTETTYFVRQIKGHYFISLGTEALVHNDSFISKEQLEWFDSVLGEACESGKPIFILCHQPIGGHNGTGKNEIDGSSVGAASAELEEILKKHTDSYTAPVFWISGHMHTLGSKTYEKNGHVHYLNLPSLEYTYGGGLGYGFEVYENRIVLKCRNFITESEL
ncbi:MAG: metallophosphoesterase, partial [Firmicutes bacterium]|nr:metallophosphoesterase [Bacillota bacterium]